jgi:Thioredoxin
MRRRRKWPTVVFIVVLAAAIAIVVAALTAAGGSGQASDPAAKKVDALLARIPQHGRYLGSSTAPVTLQYFVDVDCPLSRQITLGPLTVLIRRLVRPGRLRIEFRSQKEGTVPREVFAHQQAAALAAGVQNKLWNYLELFFEAQEELGTGEADSCTLPESLPGTVARRVPGLNLARWSEALGARALADEVTADQGAAAAAGLGASPPAYLIGPTGAQAATSLARFVRSHPAYREIVRQIDRVTFVL